MLTCENLHFPFSESAAVAISVKLLDTAKTNCLSKNYDCSYPPSIGQERLRVIERRDILALVAWNTFGVKMTVVEFQLPLDAETSSTIKAGKEPDDR
jgi:hypothetical protein